MSDPLDSLRRRFLVDEDSYETERLKDDVEKLLKYCKISKQGRVLITAKNLIDKKKVGLIIFARYVGNKLENSVSEMITADEIARDAVMEKASVNARGKELVDDGFVSRPEAATYKANPSRIQDFLDDLQTE